MRPFEIDDTTLLNELTSLRTSERKSLASFLDTLAEVDSRKLWADHACSSMHVYLTERLGYSDPTASKRVTVARAARQFPNLLNTIGSGRLHLTGAYMIAKHLTAQNHEELISKCCGRSKLEIEKRLAELFPLPEIQTTIRRLPEKRPAKNRSSECAPSPKPEGPIVPPSVEPQSSKPRSQVKPAGPRRSRVTFDLEAEEIELLQRACELTGEKDARTVILDALSHLVREKNKKKFGETEHPRPSNSRKDNLPKMPSSSRHIPANVKRKVVARCGKQCAYRDKQGRRCRERSRLEFHHIQPWGKGGATNEENVTLLCRGHNAWFATKDYGAKHMEEVITRSRERSRSD